VRAIKALFSHIVTSERDKTEKQGAMMKRRYLISILYGLLLAGILHGCGGGPGAPGSSGTEDTGVMIDATVTPNYDGSNSNSVDTFQQICNAGPPPEYEYFADHGATVSIAARLINPNTTFSVGKMHVQKYRVEYRRLNDSIGAPPIETYIGFTSIDIDPPTGTGTFIITAPVLLVDLLRKDQYATDVTSGQYSSGLAYINNYTAIYTFEGQNDFGKDFSFQAVITFQIGSFDNC
jgi:hypothetical protein